MMIVTVDGSPEKNSRYTNTINCATVNFNKRDLDAYFVATNAPGQSAFNQVERRMSNLSKELSGVILPQYQLGTHLDTERQLMRKV